MHRRSVLLRFGVWVVLSVTWPGAGEGLEGVSPETDSLLAAAKALEGSASPDGAETLTRAGMLYLWAGEADSARSAFGRAIRQKPGLAVAHCGLGRVYLELIGDPKGALPHLQAAVRADSTNPDAHYFLGLAYLRLGWAEARREADRAIRYDPKYAPAYLLLAQAHQQEGNRREAGFYYRRYLDLSPANQLPVYAYALELLQEGRFGEVEEITSRMTDEQALPLLAQALIHRGDHEGAMRAFKLYIDGLDPKERDLYLDISLVSAPQVAEVYRGMPPARREGFLQQFWLRRDSFKATGGAMRRAEHCRRVWHALTFYGQKQWPWDRRGEVYIRYGEPDYRSSSQQINAKVPPKVQRVQDNMAYQLYGTSGLGITFVGPVFPIRTDRGSFTDATDDQKREMDRALLQTLIPTSPASPNEPPAGEGVSVTTPQLGDIRDPANMAGVELDPEFAIGLNRWKPVVIGNNWAAVPWEVWVYADVGKGLEVAFTDEFKSGVYEYAPIPGVDTKDLQRLDKDQYMGQAAYMRLVQRLTELAPATRMAKVSREEPERYDLSQFEPLDFAYDVVSFRGQKGLTDVQVNLGIPIDKVALPEETDTTVLVDRRVVLINSQYTRILPAQQDIEAPISPRTRGQGLLDRVDLMNVSPGDYDLATQVQRRDTKRLQAHIQRLSLRSYPADRLGLSDLFIARHVAATEGTSDPRFVRGKWRITPLPSHIFGPGQPVFVYFEIYNLRRNPSGATRYEVAYQVRAAGAEGVARPLPATQVRDRSGETVAMRYERTGTEASVADYVELDVGDARSGQYSVQMTVKDLNGGEEVTREGVFWVAERSR